MKNPTVSRIYHSREDRIADLHTDEERVQYDAQDIERLRSLFDLVDGNADDLCTAVEKYIAVLEEEPDEDVASQMGYARRELIEKWALAQGAISKVAWALRFEGNHAYERMIEALKTGAAMDMRGL
jgi:hypothetical protein